MIARAGVHAADKVDQRGRVLDRIDAGVDVGRVTGEAAHANAIRQLALVTEHHVHRGRFADDADLRPHLEPGHRIHQPAGADAADLLVVGKREMDRRDQRSLAYDRQRRQRAGNEALHVAGASAEQRGIPDLHPVGIAVPVLAGGRDHIGMPRKHHAAAVVRTDRGVEIGAAAVFAHDQARLDAPLVEQVADKIDQLQVRATAGRVESDQPAQQRFAVKSLHSDGSPGTP